VEKYFAEEGDNLVLFVVKLVEEFQIYKSDK
jgi:hypothetical protein